MSTHNMGRFWNVYSQNVYSQNVYSQYVYYAKMSTLKMSTVPKCLLPKCLLAGVGPEGPFGQEIYNYHLPGDIWLTFKNSMYFGL